MLFVRKNALQILIPKYGLEGTIFVADKLGKSAFTYDEEVVPSHSIVYLFLLAM